MKEGEGNLIPRAAGLRLDRTTIATESIFFFHIDIRKMLEGEKVQGVAATLNVFPPISNRQSEILSSTIHAFEEGKKSTTKAISLCR